MQWKGLRYGKIKLIDLQKRRLQKCYLSLTFFTEIIKTRNEGCFSTRKLYVLLGTDIYGNRQVVGTFFENTEYNRFWLEVFENLKARGIDFVLFLVTPHNKNIERYIKSIKDYLNIEISVEDEETRLLLYGNFLKYIHQEASERQSKLYKIDRLQDRFLEFGVPIRIKKYENKYMLVYEKDK